LRGCSRIRRTRTELPACETAAPDELAAALDKEVELDSEAAVFVPKELSTVYDNELLLEEAAALNSIVDNELALKSSEEIAKTSDEDSEELYAAEEEIVLLWEELYVAAVGMATAKEVLVVDDCISLELETAAGEVDDQASSLLLEDGLHDTVVYTTVGLVAVVTLTYDVTATPPLIVNVVVEAVWGGK
jgi:hypothetical protein